MKKTAKTVVVLALVALMALALVACGGGSNGIEGTSWGLAGGKAAGIEVSKDQLTTVIGDTADMSFSFKAGGKFTMDAGGLSEEGTYKLDGNTLTMESGGSEMTASIDGNRMTMEISGIELYFDKK